MMRRKVTETGELLTVLWQLFPEMSHKKLKNYLTGHAVLVNGQIITQYNYAVKKEDIVEIKKENKTHKHSTLPILYEDENFLVVDKPAGLLSIATSKEKEKTAYHLMREFIKQRNKHEKLFVVHRLDKDTSGILLFVKHEKLKWQLQNNWNQLVKTREYMAIVSGTIPAFSSYVCYLEEDKNYQVKVVEHGGKKAITSIYPIFHNQRFSLVKVAIKTGRKNQIRVVLSHLGYPIVGDKKYGNISYPRLLLHASKLVLVHPVTHQIYTFESKVPASFSALIKS